MASHIGAGIFADIVRQLERSLFRCGAIKRGIGGNSPVTSIHHARSDALKHALSFRQASRRGLGKQASVQTVPEAGNTTSARSLYEPLFSNATKQALKEALRIVFCGLRQGTESLGARQTRQFMHEVKASTFTSPRFRIPTSSLRPSYFPNVFTGYKRATTDVGFQLSKRGFHSSGMGFQHTIKVHAPLAFRAGGDQLEDQQRKIYRKAEIAHSVNMPRSTRRFAYVIDTHISSLSKERRLLIQPQAVEENLSIMQKVEEWKSNEISVTEHKSSTFLDTENGFLSEEEGSENGSAYFVEEVGPACVTIMSIPLNAEHHLLATYADQPLNGRDDPVPFDPAELRLYDPNVLRRMNGIVEEYQRLRLGLILQVERAFDEEFLQQFRPANWTDDLFTDLYQRIRGDGILEILNIFLRVEFPDHDREEVRRLLVAATISERYIELLMNNSVTYYRDPPSSTNSNRFSSNEGLSDLDLSSPPVFSQEFSDLGNFCAEIADANQLSMSVVENQERQGDDLDPIHRFITPTLFIHENHTGDPAA